MCRKVKPKNLEELSAVLALGRPGAMQFIDQFANYTNNGVYEAIHPFFDDILKRHRRGRLVPRAIDEDGEQNRLHTRTKLKFCVVSWAKRR